MIIYLNIAAYLNILKVQNRNATDNTGHCSFSLNRRRGKAVRMNMVDNRSIQLNASCQYSNLCLKQKGQNQLRVVVVLVVWQLDLQLPVQSVPITTKVVSQNLVHGEVYSIQHYVIKFVSDLRNDITEILLKVALNTITLTIFLKGAGRLQLNCI